MRSPAFLAARRQLAAPFPLVPPSTGEEALHEPRVDLPALEVPIVEHREMERNVGLQAGDIVFFERTPHAPDC